MKKNMGNLDKFIRISVAIILAGLFFTDVITGTLGALLLVLAIIFALTSFLSFCPLYTLFGFSSRPKLKE